MPMEKRSKRPHFVAERAMEKFARWTSRTPSVAVTSSDRESAIWLGSLPRCLGFPKTSGTIR
jgi:hypothetical protein